MCLINCKYFYLLYYCILVSLYTISCVCMLCLVNYYDNYEMSAMYKLNQCNFSETFLQCWWFVGVWLVALDSYRQNTFFEVFCRDHGTKRRSNISNIGGCYDFCSISNRRLLVLSSMEITKWTIFYEKISKMYNIFNFMVSWLCSVSTLLGPSFMMTGIIWI